MSKSVVLFLVCQWSFYVSTGILPILFTNAMHCLSFYRFVNNSFHVLHPSLPQKSVQPYNLRERRHSYFLLEKTSELNERDYITRILYKNCY